MASAIAKISDESLKVIDTKCLEQVGDSGVLQSSLNDMIAVQAFAKSRGTTFVAISVLCFAAAIVSVVFFRWWLVGGICNAAMIVCLMKAYSWKKIVISPDRCNLAKQLIEIVARDSDPQTPINLLIEFSKVNDDRFIDFRKTRLSTGCSYYDANWLTLSGKFADGTQYTILVNEFTKVKQRKWIVRPKGTQLTLILAYPEKKYGAVSQLSNRLSGAISLPSGARIRTLKLVKNRLRLTVALSPGSVDRLTTAGNYVGQSGAAHTEKLCKIVTMMLLSGYQVLNLGRTMTKRAGE